MKHQPPRIAVLLPTHNGARYVEEQIASLAKNCAPFTLHWLDDHSTDNTREVVRAAAARSGIDLREWHQPQHLGYPSSFYHLLEYADADIYLYCDQDDIWQPGKIDVTAANLLADIASPVLCFSDSWVFNEKNPRTFTRLSKVFGVKTSVAMRESQAFLPWVCAGHAQGLTRALRDILVAHNDIACRYSYAHDCWTYLIAMATGTPRMLSDVPTALYRRHSESFSEFFFNPKGLGQIWELAQMMRILVAKVSQGFLLASATLPPSPKLERLVALARLWTSIERQQTPSEVIRLLRLGALSASPGFATFQILTCLLSNAEAQPASPHPMSRTNAHSMTMAES